MKFTSMYRRLSGSRTALATRVTTSTHLSLSMLILKRIRILVEGVLKVAITLPYRHRALKGIRKLHNSRLGRTALVIGNGPSLKSLDVAVIRSEYPSMDIFAVNWFPLTSEVEDLQPDYLVLSDPLTHPENREDPRNNDLWKYIYNMNDLVVLLPSWWFNSVEKSDRESGRFFFFEDTGLEGWTRNISLTRPRGYLSLTAYKALAAACYFGFDQILIIGIDNTMYKGLVVTENNSIHLNSHHFYQSSVSGDLTDTSPNGVADVFFDISLCFHDLKRCFGRHPGIVHLDPNSLVDAFPKVTRRDKLTISP